MARNDGFRNLEIPTGEKLLHGGRDDPQGHWAAPMTPTFGRTYDHEYDDDHGHHYHNVKKSVLAKVKEKAKRWRQVLAKKKHGHDAGDGGNFTPPWGVTLEDEDDDEERDPEYHGAPMYESEMAPDSYKQSASQHPTAGKETAKHHPGAHHKATLEHQDSFRERNILPAVKTPAPADKRAMETKVVDPASTTENGSSKKTLAETVTDMIAPAYAVVTEAVTEATHAIALKIQSPRAGGNGEESSLSKQMWDRGVSVKGYLMQKLEPGEDERALSEVITEAMSPRKAGGGGEMGVAERVKGAVTSLLGMEEEPPAPVVVTIPRQSSVSINSKASLSPNTDSRRPLPVSVNPPVSRASAAFQPTPLASNPRPVQASEISRPSPVSSTARADEIQEEESGGRILQTYTN